MAIALLFTILTIPLVLATFPLFIKKTKDIGILTAAGYFIASACALALAIRLASDKISFFGFLFADSLSGFFILLISVINAVSALYSIGYIENDIATGAVTLRKAKTYYLLFNAFAFTMLSTVVLDNLGFVWVAIEMTTLASAFLVGFYNTKHSVEAAWKYLIICSVGITLALLGTILFYYTGSVHGGISSLNWTEMTAAAYKMNPDILKIAFLFILVGYGTKAGIAPMHTWLPDAHSQALAPVSAMLSGVLLKTALYAIIRFSVIVNTGLGTQYTGNLFVFFGLLSMAVAAGFIIVQNDIKRLLAYSSIEHIGVVLFGLGIGGPFAVFGALFHMFNHAATKSLMFFGAGSIVKRYGTHNMNMIRGVARVMPFTGIMFLLGAFALTGSPPFSIFISEIIVLVSAFTSGHYIAAITFLILVAVVFAGVIHHVSKVVFGKKPEGMPEAAGVVSEPAGHKAAFVILLIIMVVFGLYMPAFFTNILDAAANVVKGI